MRFFITVLLSLILPLPAAAELTLAHAEHLALTSAPWLSHHRSHADRARHRVVYEAELPDPQLVLGAQNVPVDSFSRREDEMTMLMIGVRQAFPPGDTRALTSEKAARMAEREHAAYELERRGTLKRVRELWFMRRYVESALSLLEEMRVLLERDLQSAQSRYRAAADSQQSVHQARQALSRLRLRVTALDAELESIKAQLAQLIGAAADEPLGPETDWPSADPTAFTVDHHPLMLMAQANLDAAKVAVNIERQAYKPGYALDVAYGQREDRSDMLTALVMIDLPIRTSKRQDPRVADMQAHATAVEFEAETRRRELTARYRTAAAERAALKTRLEILNTELLRDIAREAEVTVAGFARDQTAYRAARLKGLETQVEAARLRAELARADAELLFLTGEVSHETH